MTDQQFIARCFVPGDLPDPMAQISLALGPGPFALIVLFMASELDLARLARAAQTSFADVPVIGCTTAGEIGGKGYEAGGIVALAFHASHFAAQTLLIRDLGGASASGLGDVLIRMRNQLRYEHAGLGHEFSLLLVDGLSVKEDELAASLALGAAGMPVMGGSAGDGTRFAQTFVLYEGAFLQNAAVLAVMRTDCLLQSFCFDHLEPTEIRMVVTEADPAVRVVRRFNGELAVVEYARLLGLDPLDVDPFNAGMRPLAVRLGKRHHVRAVQRCLPSGEMKFFAAIDEGVVLTVTTARDQLAHLRDVLEQLNSPQAPAAILAFDCILRRVEFERSQSVSAASQLLAQYGVIGFNTYGEQVGALHVNQTFSGYAFYPPADESLASGPLAATPLAFGIEAKP